MSEQPITDPDLASAYVVAGEVQHAPCTTCRTATTPDRHGRASGRTSPAIGAAVTDLPEAAVEAVWSLFACRCLPAWTERKLHAPDCIQELGHDVLDIVAKACADERARVLDEVQAALRNVDGFNRWQMSTSRTKGPDGQHWAAHIADYLRDTVGAGDEG